MIILLKNVECYSPKYQGLKDILIGGDKIFKIAKPGAVPESGIFERIIDCGGLMAFPGLIDQHIHLAGGGGEQGFLSRIPDVDLNQIIKAGVTTVVGLLGADNITRSPENLYAAAKALELKGITTYLYTGSYSVPIVTFTGSVIKDLVLIDKVIGTGEIAVSDHRSSQPTIEQLQKLASDTHLGGLLGNKAGVMHIHIGDGKKGLQPFLDIVNGCDLPIETFVPTHCNRNPQLFTEAAKYCLTGGYIDLTAGETAGLAVKDAIAALAAMKVDLSRVTVSSDANGSIPGGGISLEETLLEDIKSCIVENKTDTETAFSLATSNVARILKLYPKKGTLQEGGDADILLTDKNYNVNKLIAMGKLLYET